MPDIQFSPLPDVQRPLLEKFYRAHRSPMRAKGKAQMWVARQPDIVGALCLTPVTGGHWLTGLFVAPAERGRGVAAGLLAAALTSVEGNVWLFCEPELRGFYQPIGFTEIQDLPQDLAARLARYRQTKRLISLVRSADLWASNRLEPFLRYTKPKVPSSNGPCVLASPIIS